MNPTQEIPHDAALPGLAVLRSDGPMGALPTLCLNGPVELVLRGYTAGKRATLEARCANRRVAIKACAKDPTPEVRLYEELAASGLAVNGRARAEQEVVRVPQLLAWDRNLHLVAMAWLDGRTGNQLVKDGQGVRAGELAARWFRRAASLRLRLGHCYGPEHVLDKAPRWAATLAGADMVLGKVAATVARALVATPPAVESVHLIHGTLYARHVIDMGDGPGLIDWDAFGHGPMEYDAATFLATLWRIQLSNAGTVGAVAQAERAFLAGTTGLLNRPALSWYRAAVLLSIAHRLEVRSKRNWKARALALLSEAARLAVTAAA